MGQHVIAVRTGITEAPLDLTEAASSVAVIPVAVRSVMTGAVSANVNPMLSVLTVIDVQ